MTDNNSDKLVLVTGGTGFVGVHCILQLLNKGYKVRTSIRSLVRENEVIAMLNNGGEVKSVKNLSFIEADLSKDTNWDEAAKRCDYVLHIASPVPLSMPKDEKEVISPAVEGTIRILKAAKRAGVKRVVLTSSFAAVGYSHKDVNTLITEENWTDPNDKNLSTYIKSKTLAEIAAWDFITANGKGLELSVICPGFILGPSLGADLPSSIRALKQLLDGTMKAVPKISFGIVDVRDVADLHIRAMTSSAANGQRFLASSGDPLTLHDIALLLKQKLGEKAKQVPTKVLPNWVVQIAALFSLTAKDLVPQLNRIKNSNNEKAKKLLGWSPRSYEEAILASVESILQFEQEKNNS